MPSCFFGAAGSVRHTTKIQSAMWPRLVHTFWPLITHSSPSCTAVVFTLARSEPASGSLKPWHQNSAGFEDRRQKSLLVLLGAEHHQGGAEQLLAEEADALWAGGPDVLLVEDELLGQRQLASAVLRRPAHSDPTARGELLLPCFPDFELRALAEVGTGPELRRTRPGGALRARSSLRHGTPHRLRRTRSPSITR